MILERDIDEINVNNYDVVGWCCHKGWLWDHNFYVIFVDILRTCRNKETIVLDGGEDKED